MDGLCLVLITSFQPLVQPPPNSLRLRDFFWVALLGGGVGYLLAHLVKVFSNHTLHSLPSIGIWLAYNPNLCFMEITS